jgi:hypothetical protein
LATKKKAQTDDDRETNETIQLQRDLAIEVFIHNSRAIAKSTKTERLIKMAHDCPELKPITPTNKELWRIVQKVRREVLGGDTKPESKTASRRKTKGNG